MSRQFQIIPKRVKHINGTLLARLPYCIPAFVGQ